MFEEMVNFDNCITWDKFGGVIKSDIYYKTDLKQATTVKDLISKVQFDPMRFIFAFECENNCFFYDLTNFNRVQITIEEMKYLMIYPYNKCQPKTIEFIYSLISPFISKIECHYYLIL